jgi:hypothetical protein
MTFLLFLASVAVLEYLLKDVKTPAGNLQPADLGGEHEISHQTATSDLMALSQALGMQKPIAAPDAQPAPKEVAHGS